MGRVQGMWGGHRVHVSNDARIYCDDDMRHCWAHRAPGTIDDLDDLDDGHQDDLDGCKMTLMFSNGQWG